MQNEIGRWHNTPSVERICKLCRQETNFLLYYPKYQQCRITFESRMIQKCEQLDVLSIYEKLDICIKKQQCINV